MAQDRDGTTIAGSSSGISTRDGGPGTGSEERILDLYEVLSPPIEGGMGKVLHVRHTGWGMDLALKQPHAHLFGSQEQRDAFARECDVWIDMGLHPHIVSCYYVREIDGIPSIFSEWMEGGSLADWMADGRLYTGSPQDQLCRIIDIAIQYARGLGFAHERGVIHQDVKPDNALLDGNGTVKVADFGIANARAALADDGNSPLAAQGTMQSESGGYTPAYCSPEQMAGATLTRRTDIWSWAVTVLEMLLRDRPWPNGVVAGVACEEYLGMVGYDLPQTLRSLIVQCLQQEEGARPGDFDTIATALQIIYPSIASAPYPRKKPAEVKQSASSLNNRALSYLDLADDETALRYWGDALSLETTHPESTLNQSIYFWRNKKAFWPAASQLLEKALIGVGNEDYAQYLQAKLVLERGNHVLALDLLDAVQGLDEAQELAEWIRAQSLYSAFHFGDETVRQCLVHPSSAFAITVAVDNEASTKTANGAYLPDLVPFSPKPLLWEADCEGGPRALDSFPSASVCMSPQGNYVVCLENVYFFSIFKAGSWESPLSCGSTESVLRAFCFSPDEREVYAAREDGTIERWDCETGRLNSRINFGVAISALACTPDGGSLVICHDAYRLPDGEGWSALSKLDIRTNALEKRYRTLPGRTCHLVSIAADGKSFAAAHDQGYDIWMIGNEAAPADTGSIKPHYIDRIRNFAYIAEEGILFMQDPPHTALASTIDDSLRDTFFNTAFTAVGSAVHLIDSDTPRHGYAYRYAPSLQKSPWVLSRIISSDEQASYNDQIKAITQAVTAAVEDGDIAAALKALEQAHSIPDFTATREYCKLNHEVGRFCRIKGLRSKFTERRPTEKGVTTGIAYSRDGRYCVSTEEIIDLLTFQEVYAFPDAFAHRSDKKASFLADGRVAIVAPGSHEMLIGSLGDGTVQFGASGNEGVQFGTVELGGGKAFTDVDAHPVRPEFMLAIRNPKDGGAGSPHSTARIIEMASGSIVRDITLPGDIVGMRYHPDGQKAVFVVALEGADENRYLPSGHRVILWDLGKGAEAWHSDFTAVFESVEFIPFGNRIALRIHPEAPVSGKECTNLFVLMDTASGHIVAQYLYLDDDRAYSQDGRHLIARMKRMRPEEGDQRALDPDEGCPIWDLETGRYSGRWPEKSAQYLNERAFPHIGWRVVTTFNFDYEFPGWADWDEGAQPIVDLFLALHPDWGPTEFAQLIKTLQFHGYGWLKSAAVFMKLESLG